jgi:hypothetical protein
LAEIRNGLSVAQPSAGAIGDKRESTIRFFSLGSETTRASPCILARAKLYGRHPIEAANRLGNEPNNVPNPWVQFRINDAYVPEPVQILMELHGKELLRGKIIDVSSADSQEEAFAVVEVEGLSQPVVVPMKHIKEMR